MARWMRPEEEMPGDCECGDRLCIIVAERESPKHRIAPRLVILIATENGWDSTEDVFQGYGPGDGILWAWEKDVCGIAHAIFPDWDFSKRRPVSPIIDREEVRRMIDARDQCIAVQAECIAKQREVILGLCEAWLNCGGTTDLPAFEESQKILYPDLHRGEEYGHIATVHVAGWKPRSMAIANARLIAAAPDLLAACKLMLAMCESIGTFDNGVEHNGLNEGEVMAAGVMDKARDVIRKAGYQ